MQERPSLSISLIACGIASGLARSQTFRFLTMIATWVLIFGAFVYHPEWIREWLRLMTHAIESLADQVPEPWGARLEIILQELGGMIWIQIASAIVLLRLIIWVPFIWRMRRERRLRIGQTDILSIHTNRRPDIGRV
jgi:hypothetical protein